MKRRYDGLIPLKVVRKVYLEEPSSTGEKPKSKKTTKMIEYFDRYEICKIEPTLHPQTLKKSNTRCMIFYKPNNTYYEIAEPLKEVYKKVHEVEEPIKIGFRYGKIKH